MEKVILGQPIGLEEFIQAAVYGSQVEFSEEYKNRVENSRRILEACVDRQ